MVEPDRSHACARLPVPVVGRLAAPSPQFARRGQFHPVAGRVAVDGRRTALVDVSPANRVARWLNVAIYDLANVLLLTGILLFPHGNLSWRRVGLIALLPVLMFLRGTLYQTFFVCCMILAVLSLLRCLRLTDSSEQRQQVRWALFGITSYAVLRTLAILADTFKWSADSFGHQLLVEMSAGMRLALAVLVLQF